MKPALRLFPAVAGAATALLVLKAIAFLDGPSPDQVAAAGRSGLAAASSTFFSVRSDSLYDPETTGSTPEPKKDDKKDEKKDDKKDAKKPPAPTGTPVNLDAPAVSPAEKALLEKLGQRREQLDERQREIETRENLLKAADKKLESRINELKELETRTGTSAPSGDGPAAGAPGTPGGNASVPPAIRNLVIMYETMKPKDAARVFDKLDLPVLVPVVNAMNPKKMAEILAAMSPESAGKLTLELASKGLRAGGGGRNEGALPAGELPAIEPRKP